MSGFMGQFMVADEVTWNTGVTPTRGFEVASAAIKNQPMRIEVPTIRAGRRVMKHRQPYSGGAAGQVQMPVMSAGFGWWLRHMLGAVATGAEVDDAFDHVGTVAIPSASFTAQTGVPRTSGAAVLPQTATGGRLTSWELSCEGGGEVKFSADCDFAGWTRATALATAVYPADAVPLTFVRGSVTVDGTPVVSDSWSFKFNPNLLADRRGIGVVKREQKVNGLASASLDLAIDFEDNVMIDHINSATQAGAESSVVLRIEDTALIGVTSRAALEIEIPVCMWDGDVPSLEGVEQTKFPVKGVMGTNDVDSPVTITYTSEDAVA